MNAKLKFESVVMRLNCKTGSSVVVDLVLISIEICILVPPGQKL